MKVICIGRNYSEHAKEMNSELPNEPLFFLKPETAVYNNPKEFYYPSFTKNLHYECELIIKIKKIGKHISEEFANKYYDEYSLGIDFTARDIQDICKSKGEPWEKAKAFDNSAIVSNIFFNKFEYPISNVIFLLKLNNSVVQHGNPNKMIFTIDQIISHVSKYITLKSGDLIFTGTPAGVGQVNINDKLSGEINNIEVFNFIVK